MIFVQKFHFGQNFIKNVRQRHSIGQASFDDRAVEKLGNKREDQIVHENGTEEQPSGKMDIVKHPGVEIAPKTRFGSAGRHRTQWRLRHDSRFFIPGWVST